MKIIHKPRFKTDRVIEHYSLKDGVPIQYVCSSECSRDNEVEDIFYRETPHPEFGNRYFGLISLNNQTYIRNADSIENKAFGCVKNDDGDLEYSECRWDYKKFQNGNMIDGGRAYIKSTGKVRVYFVKDGVLQEVNE
jgi:hypothetical protein